MKGKATIPDDHSVPGVGTASEPDHHVAPLGKDVNDLALAFVAPLQSNHADVHSTRASQNAPKTGSSNKPQ